MTANAERDTLSIDKISAALAKAQGEMLNPVFDRVNPHFNSKFASLAAVRDAVVPPLARNGIAVITKVETLQGGGVSCTLTFSHESGQFITFPPFVIPCEPDAQKIGAARTYAVRYALLSAACVSGDDDDDGQTISGLGPKVNEDQLKELRKLIEEVEADEAKLCKVLKLAKLEDVKAANLPAVRSMIEAKRKRTE